VQVAGWVLLIALLCANNSCDVCVTVQLYVVMVVEVTVGSHLSVGQWTPVLLVSHKNINFSLKASWQGSSGVSNVNIGYLYTLYSLSELLFLHEYVIFSANHDKLLLSV